MDYTETQKKRMRLAATRRDRQTLKTSMLMFAATRGKAIAEMRAAELEAGRQAAQRKAALRAAQSEA
jgi:hypothetical protein